MITNVIQIISTISTALFGIWIIKANSSENKRKSSKIGLIGILVGLFFSLLFAGVKYIEDKQISNKKKVTEDSLRVANDSLKKMGARIQYLVGNTLDTVVNTQHKADSIILSMYMQSQRLDTIVTSYSKVYTNMIDLNKKFLRGSHPLVKPSIDLVAELTIGEDDSLYQKYKELIEQADSAIKRKEITYKRYFILDAGVSARYIVKNSKPELTDLIFDTYEMVANNNLFDDFLFGAILLIKKGRDKNISSNLDYLCSHDILMIDFTNNPTPNQRLGINYEVPAERKITLRKLRHFIQIILEWKSNSDINNEYINKKFNSVYDLLNATWYLEIFPEKQKALNLHSFKLSFGSNHSDVFSLARLIEGKFNKHTWIKYIEPINSNTKSVDFKVSDIK